MPDELPFPEELDAWREGVVQALARKGGNGLDGGGDGAPEDTARALEVMDEHVSMLAFSVRQLFVSVCTLFDHVQKTDRALREYVHEVRGARKELSQARRALENASGRTPWPWLIAGALGGLLGGLALGLALGALL
ncbi:MAG TPA: hypothetical protein ENJ40_07960 [Thermosulfurimonas dismutans]|uniref:Uncharacterized protein n=1 Tax=Thermosulfurimonas dismutans TaxID=999894 RepID=A0A7C3CL20_9BACT|nr:hypothetical protein [Thermosulfurimonas dismutans]